MVIHKAYRLKLYPNKTQEKRLLEIADGARFVWNYYLAQKRDRYLMGGKSPSYLQCARDLTDLKRQDGMEWLDGVLVHPLQQSLRSLDRAYGAFFRKSAQFPRFKSKKDSRRSFRIPVGWKLRGSKLQIERGVVIRMRGTHPPMKARQMSVTVSRDACGTWWASILTEQEIKPKKKTGAPLGVDLGLNHLAVLSDGRKIENIRPRKQLQKRMKTLQRLLARKEKGSNASILVKLALARLHRKVGYVRSNHLHHVSKQIASENQAVIVCEDLAVKNMIRNHRLASSIADASWSELIRQLQYKQEWSGGTLVKIGRFFPSSKTCSSCGFIIQELALSVRYWTCPSCHESHDRDVNAAKVIASQWPGNGLARRVQMVSRPSGRERVTGSVKR